MYKVNLILKKEIEFVSLLQTSVMPQRSLLIFNRWRKGTDSSEGRRQVDSSHSYSPQKMRMEDSRERRRTLSWPVGIQVELRSWIRRKSHFIHRRKSIFLHWRMNFNWRTRDGGCFQTRPTSNRCNSWNYWNWGKNRFQTVHRHRIWFIPNLENKKFLRVSENKIRSSVERRQRRFRCVILNKQVFGLHQGSRKRSRLRLRDQVMSGRSRETLDCLLNLSEKSFRRKFRMFEELAWKR